MKGTIEKVLHATGKAIFICGDDGRTYFGVNEHFLRKSKHYTKGKMVTFDVVKDEEHAHDRAVNIDVEIPENPSQPQSELISIRHLLDGAIIKRKREPTGELHSYIIKDGKLIIHALTEYEKDIVWVYRRGPSGYEEGTDDR